MQKKLTVLLTGFLMLVISSYANASNNDVTSTSYNANGKTFIFTENGIEFSIFRDGQFDFNILGNNSNLSISLNTRNTNISFNTGYNYNNYVQYDEYGAIVQIENTPVYYDDYGRISQVGNINIYYNNLGYISRVGGLYINYNRYNQFTYSTGYINIYNRTYVYRPWHQFYCTPSYQYAVVYNQPYRRYYQPVRYNYSRPFYNNYRPKTAIASRRGNTVYKNRNYATVNRSTRNVTTINTRANSRRTVVSSKRASKIATTRPTATNNPRSTLYKSSARTISTNASRDTKIKSPTSGYNTRSNSSRKAKQSVNNSNRTMIKPNNISKTQNTQSFQKPNSAKSRTYITKDIKARNTQISKRTVNTSRTAQKSKVTRATQNSKRNVTYSRSN